MVSAPKITLPKGHEVLMVKIRLGILTYPDLAKPEILKPYKDQWNYVGEMWKEMGFWSYLTSIRKVVRADDFISTVLPAPMAYVHLAYYYPQEFQDWLRDRNK